MVDPFLILNVHDWQEDQAGVLDAASRKFNAEKVIVRSSAFHEDRPGCSLAGYFKSELASSASNRLQLLSAIESVVNSYSRDERRLSVQDEFLIQRYVEDVACSGVIITRDWPSLAPYYVINFDDESGRTDTVTQGLYGRQIKIARWASRSVVPQDWRALLLSVGEIEELFATDSLQIEFALDGEGIVHIFQVRALIHPDFTASDRDKIIRHTVAVLQRRLRRERRLSGDLLLSDMSDWNPAEMLGSRCNNLDYSLYRMLITSSNWARARAAMGYTDVQPYELMQKVADKPYMDVSVSLRSLIPSTIPAALSDRLVEFGVDKISRIPELQDKVEFSAAFSCFDFSFEQKAGELVGFGFSAKDLDSIRRFLVMFTNFHLRDGAALLARNIRSARHLDRIRQEISLGIGRQSLQESRRWINSSLIACRDYGVFPFAQSARLSFLGIALLRGIAGRLEDENLVNEFLASVETIAGRMNRDLCAVQRGRLSRDKFLAIYGHLRPGTYNITAMRLDQIDGLFDAVPNAVPQRRQRNPAQGRESLSKIDALLKSEGVTFSARHLLDFTAKALKARELCKFHFTRVVSEVLEVIASIGAHAGFGRDEMALLDVSAVTMVSKRLGSYDALRSSWRTEIEKRRAERDIFRFIALPPVLKAPRDLACFEYYKAKPNFVNRTRVEGPIVILDRAHSQHDPGSLAGRIVLVENADPGHDWLFSCSIAGLITKYGGVASHMAIRCGEFGLPAAIGCGEIVFQNVCKGSRACIDGQAEAVFSI
jgi:phosphohistidine swiveling domain-containing protein